MVELKYIFPLKKKKKLLKVKKRLFSFSLFVSLTLLP